LKRGGQNTIEEHGGDPGITPSWAESQYMVTYFEYPGYRNHLPLEWQGAYGDSGSGAFDASQTNSIFLGLAGWVAPTNYGGRR
jgi:hypothetical protein